MFECLHLEAEDVKPSRNQKSLNIKFSKDIEMEKFEFKPFNQGLLLP